MKISVDIRNQYFFDFPGGGTYADSMPRFAWRMVGNVPGFLLAQL
jgi:hypothetical protein